MRKGRKWWGIRENASTECPRSSAADLHVYSPVDSVVHEMLLDALATYAVADGISVAVIPSGWRGLMRLISLSGSVVWVGATGLPSVFGLPIVRCRGNAIGYYLHEPTTLAAKVRRRNGLLKSVVWHLVQKLDVSVAHLIVVSRPALRDRTQEIYRAEKRRLSVAPLLLPPPVCPPANRNRLTYLGRLDGRRGLREFLDAAPRIADLGLVPTIVTGDVADLKRLSVPPIVDVHASRRLPEGRKGRLLAETSVVWNPRSFAISQSGVTADALRYGCRVLLTRGDPMYDELVEAGVAIDFHAAQDGGYRVCIQPGDPALGEVTAALFSRLFGSEAFRQYYRPVLEHLGCLLDGRPEPIR